MSTKSNNNSYNIILVLIFVAFLSLGGIFVKLSTVGPINTAFFRVLFSLVILFPLLLVEKTRPSYNKLKRKELMILLVAGAFFGADLTLLNISFHSTTMANANLFSNFVPLIIVPFSYFFFKEQISKNFLIGFLVILVGVILLILGKESITTENLLGDTLAFLVSIFYASFLLLVYKIRHKASPVQIMYYSGYGALIVLFIICILTEGIHAPTTWASFLPLLGLTIFSQVLGQGGLSYSLGKISASLASILILTQPVISAVYAFFIFGEKLTTLEIISLFVIISGIYLLKKTDD